MGKSGHKSITRIDDRKKHMHGWYVRVNFNLQRRARMFSDKKFGGSAEALEAAIRFRDEAERELGRPRTDRVVIGASSKNTSGIVGIQRRPSSFVVNWNGEAGRISRKFFPIEKTDDPQKQARAEREARNKAVRFRREKEKQLYGKTITVNWQRALTTLAGAGK